MRKVRLRCHRPSCEKCVVKLQISAPPSLPSVPSDPSNRSDWKLYDQVRRDCAVAISDIVTSLGDNLLRNVVGSITNVSFVLSDCM